MAQLRDPGRVPRNDGFGDIPYAALSRQFLRDPEQRLVPFLGAGASRPTVPQGDTRPAPVDPQLLQELVDKLQVRTEDAKMFLEIALAILSRLKRIGACAAVAERLRIRPGQPFRQ